MDVTSSFVARSVTSTVDLNWVFLVDWLIVFFASIVFIFYFNRLIGTIVTLLITHVFWRRKKIKISVQALKLNLLGGRIFVKNLTIVTKNEMILIHTAVFTWKYWLRFTKKSQYYVEEQNLDASINKKLPSRFCLDVVGLQVFVYNKSTAYDDIEEILKNEALHVNKRNSHHQHRSNTTTNINKSSLNHRKRSESSTKSMNNVETHPSTSTKTEKSKEYEFDEITQDETASEIMDTTFLDFLPLDIKITKGSFVLGNENTPSLYVLSYTSMNGQIDATLPGSQLDYYRTNYDFTATNLKVDLRTNVSFKDIDSLESKINARKNKNRNKNFISVITGLGHSIKSLQKYFEHSNSAYKSNFTFLKNNSYLSNETTDLSSEGIEEWHGLDRYLSAVSSSDSGFVSTLYDYDRQKMIDTEYAKCSNIIEAQICKINYYYDSQGLVPKEQIDSDFIEDPDIGNKDIPPMFGLDITVSGATICYGPWAEKQRGSLHQIVFPSLYRNSIPFKKLKTGMRRQYISFDLSLQCEDDMVFRVPHREESKDIRFLKNNSLSLRHYGWLDLKIAKGSITDISVALIPTIEKGIDNKINAVFVKPEISTSVNHDILFKADEHILNASVAYPLGWNSLADWKFENISKSVSIYLLREHITLLSDMFSDFGSGEPTPYELFRPFIYRFNWKLYDYSIYLNINEKNIINNPLDHAINTYMTFKGSYLYLNTKIPLTSVYKKSNTVDFVLETTYFNLSIEHPVSSTFSNFLKDEEIGNANDFKLVGSYTYFSFMEIDSIDTIIMNCTCKYTTLKAYGFAVKYFMSLKENYFGDNTHFQNLLEFKDYFFYNQEKKENINVFEGKRIKNETDLMFSFCVDNGCLILPCNLYDCESHVALHFDYLDIDIRNNNYYMDLQADLSEAKGRYVKNCKESEIFDNTKSKLDFDPEIIIDDLSIHSIRIFGIPPTEPTYFCRWTFETDGIHINSEPIFLNALSRVGTTFAFGHTDLENSLELPVVSVMDIVNLSFKCPIIDIKLHSDDYNINITFSDLLLKRTDQPTIFYNAYMNLAVKNILIQGFKNDLKILQIQTSLKLKSFVQKEKAYEVLEKQAMHLKKNDGPFHRVPFLIPDFARDRRYHQDIGSLTTSINIPDPPLPLTNESVEMIIDKFPVDIQKKILSMDSLFDNNNEIYDEAKKFTTNLEDFDILKSLDPNCEYNNMPIDLEKLEIFLSPELASVAVDFASKSVEFNMNFLLDNLQTEFVKYFKFKEKNEILRCKMNCPLITLKLADFSESESCLFLGIKDLVFAFSKETNKQLPSLNIHTMVDQLTFDFIKDGNEAFSLTLNDLVLKQSTSKRQVAVVNLDSISFDLDPQLIPAMITMVLRLMKVFEEASSRWEVVQKNRKAASIELLYELSKGGIDYNIIHDPPCITKPSYITGFCKKHIRMDGSWMIIPRLRHVLQHLPEDILKSKNEKFQEKLWEAPKSAEDEVAMIFGNWRCWDNHKTSDNFIFKQAFGSSIKEKIKLFNTFKFSITNIIVSIKPFQKALNIYKIFFSLNQDILSNTVREIALPLLDYPIENALDINLKIDSIITNFTKINKILPNIIPLIEEIKSAVNNLKISFKDNDDDLGSTASLNDVERYEAVTPVLITMNFSLNNFLTSIGIDKSLMSFYGQTVNMSASMVNAEEIMSCNVNFESDFFRSEFKIKDMVVYELVSESHSSTLVNTGTFKLGQTSVVIANEILKIDFPVDSKHLTKVLSILIKNEYLAIKPILDQFKKTENSLSTVDETSVNSSYTNLFDTLSTNIFNKVQMNLSIFINLNEISTHFELLSPFYTNFGLNNASLCFKFGPLGFLTNFFIQKSVWTLSSETSNHPVFDYATMIVNYIKLSFGASYTENFYKVLFSLCIDNIDLILKPSLVDIIIRLQTDVKTASENLKRIKYYVKKLGKLLDQNTHPSKLETSESIDYKSLGQLVRAFFNIKVDKIGLVFNINRNTFHVSCISPTLIFETYNSQINKLAPRGKLELQTIIFLNPQLISDSTLFDSKLTIEIKTTSHTDHSSQRLNIHSEYCRLVLNPNILEELINAYGDIILSIKHEQAGECETKTDPINFEQKIESLLSFICINITANNVCLGLLFDENDNIFNNVAPGIILGFESTTVACAKDAGKIQTTGLYLSTAHGYTPSTYYSQETEKIHDNRVYFPLFNLVYVLQVDGGKRNFKAKVDGEKVDFKFQTNIFSITESLWKSIYSVQDKVYQIQVKINDMKKLHGCYNHKKDLEGGMASPLSPIIKSNLKTTISCIFTFAGASFFMYNPQVEINGSTPILSLQSPQLSAVLKYSHDVSKLKKHSIFFSALISETNNKLSCMCVPILQDITKGIQNIMRKSNKHMANKRATNTKSSTSENGINIVHLSEKININFSLKIEPQRLALSCEPRANIEAEVGLEDIHLIIKSDHDFLSAVLSVKSVKSELKHAYSKVTSGSICANKFTINCTMGNMGEEKKFISVANLDEVDAFINIQQRQDLDLFKDLWLPGNFSDSLLIRKSKTTESKTFATLLREVTTTIAFPWILSLLVSKVSARVNLGSSLGELNVDIKHFMVISTKFIDWNQNMKFEVELINIESRGRLSGMLKIQKTRMTSAISWKRNDEFLKIPQVLLSVGFKSLQSKISLDFHPFFITEIINLGVTVFNQRINADKQDKLKCHLSVNSFKVFMTALACSNFVDVYTIGLRIRQDIKISYKQVLNDAQINLKDQHNIGNSIDNANITSKHEIYKPSTTFLTMIEKLKTFLDINVGILEIQVFPSSLFDSQAMVINIGKQKAKFYQNNLYKIENKISLDLSDITVSLSSYKNKIVPDMINEENGIDLYIASIGSNAVADNIFVFPSLTIKMETYENEENNVVKYKYSCKFGGRVDIKWKIGSVYFIKEMWYTHATTLSNRLTALRIYTSDEYNEDVEENYKESTLETVNLEDRLKDVESDEKYVYEAIEDVDIETPQLRDLGNATPPLEWFGLHRNKFPNLTHQFVIMGLQKIIQEVEKKYSKVLK